MTAADIKSMTIDELKNLMTELGDKPFRAKQIYSWLHEHLVSSYEEMTNLPKGLREKLKDYPITVLEAVDVQTSRIPSIFSSTVSLCFQGFAQFFQRPLFYAGHITSGNL